MGQLEWILHNWVSGGTTTQLSDSTIMTKKINFFFKNHIYTCKKINKINVLNSTLKKYYIIYFNMFSYRDINFQNYELIRILRDKNFIVSV